MVEQKRESKHNDTPPNTNITDAQYSAGGGVPSSTHMCEYECHWGNPYDGGRIGVQFHSPGPGCGLLDWSRSSKSSLMIQEATGEQYHLLVYCYWGGGWEYKGGVGSY